MLTNLRRIEEHRENFNTGIEYIRKYQTEVIGLKNTIIELKITLQVFNNTR